METKLDRENIVYGITYRSPHTHTESNWWEETIEEEHICIKLYIIYIRMMREREKDLGYPKARTC